jgi:integrase
MARFATSGQLLRNASGYSARIRVGPAPKDRRVFPLAARSEAEAEQRAALLADIAKRLRPVAAPDEIAELLLEGGKARTERGLAVVIEAADAIASGTTTRAKSAIAPTFADFAAEWTSKDLHRRYPDHVRDKDETEDVQQLRDYINPQIGSTRLPDVALEHAEKVMQALPAALGPRTRRHVAQCMRKVLSLAVYPGRHIAANPIPREWMPTIPKSANKAKSTLFPDEDAKLCSCPAVALERRIAYGILAREGMRASELGELRFSDVDLVRGRVRLDENKTDDPRAWALSPDVVRVLAWWKKRRKAEEGDRVLDLDLSQGPRWLRGKTWKKKSRHKDEVGDLRTAGITRAELFERTGSRMPVRLHDLRACFVTVSLANGKTEQWVTDRTGHKSSQMLSLYTRQARTWAELGLGALQPLDELLPEMKARGPGSAPPANSGPDGERNAGRAKRRGTPSNANPKSAAILPADSLGSDWAANGSDCWTRTSDPAVNSRLLYQLS